MILRRLIGGIMGQCNVTLHTNTSETDINDPYLRRTDVKKAKCVSAYFNRRLSSEAHTNSPAITQSSTHVHSFHISSIRNGNHVRKNMYICLILKLPYAVCINLTIATPTYSHLYCIQQYMFTFLVLVVCQQRSQNTTRNTQHSIHIPIRTASPAVKWIRKYCGRMQMTLCYWLKKKRCYRA
jgi:hypothetical protein